MIEATEFIPTLTLDELSLLATRTQIEISEFISAALARYRAAGGLPVAGMKVDVARNNGRVGVRLLVTL